MGASFYHGVSENAIRVGIAHSTRALLLCRCGLAPLGAFINATTGPRHPRQVHTSSKHRINRSIHVHEDSQHLTYLRVNRTLRFFFVNYVVGAATSRASSAASTPQRKVPRHVVPPYPYPNPFLHALPLHSDAPNELQCFNHSPCKLCI